MSTATKLAYSVQEAAEATGLSVTFIDAAIRRADLKARRTVLRENGEVAGKRVILAADLAAFLENLPEG